MKFSSYIFVVIFGLIASTAFANEPCPTAVPDTPKLDNPNEKCKPELGETAPVLFVFPEEPKKTESESDKSPDTAHKQLKSDDETPDQAEKKSL